MNIRPMTFAAATALALTAAACSRERQPASPAPDAIATEAASLPQVIASAPDAVPPAAHAGAPKLALEGEGLRLFNPAKGAARALPFGTGWAQAQAALAFRGRPATGRNEECGAGPLDYAKWPDSLTLYGQDGKFVGWFAEDPRASLATAAGVGPGSTRRALEGAYKVDVFESSFGTEFAAGTLAGVLDGEGPAANIKAMWAGTSCNLD